MTVRDNILFGEAYDAAWYRRVVESCCLLPDFEQLPAGELTEIGERGINLSGGQKQRISLARAVYANHDVYLLDDALSAVDAHVGRRIFNRCIRGLLRDKSVLLVTHQLQYLPRCDHVAFVHQQHLQVGTYASLLKTASGFDELIQHHHQDHDQDEGESGQGGVGSDSEEEEEGEEEGDSVGDSGTSDAVARTGPLTETIASAAGDQHEEGSDELDQAAEASGLSAGATVSDPADPTQTPASPLTAQTPVTSSSASGTALPLPAAPVQDGVSPPQPVEDNPLKRNILYQAVALDNSSVAWGTYLAYARASGGAFWFLLIIMLFLIAMGTKVFSDWYLSFWIREGDGTTSAGNLADNPDRNRHALIFGMTIIALVVMQLIRGFMYTRAVLRASTRLHAQLFSRVVAGTMAFFHTTPLGRIINRFSKDTDELDSRLVLLMEQFFQNLALILTTIALIAYVLPFFLVALVPIGTAFILFVRYFRSTQRQVKRLDNMTQAPLFSHLTASLQGMATIAAFRKGAAFENIFFDLLEVNSRCFFSFYYTSRWFGLRLDFVSTAIMAATGILVVTTDVEPTLAALALTYAMAMGGFFQFTTRLSAEVEGRFTSAERILDFIDDVPIEDQRPDRVPVPPSWPDRGCIEFKNVEAAYRAELPPVTSGLSFVIRAQEKIGIAGRTGAGKSTLAACLYRMMEMRQGGIVIDGLDIEQLSLQTLRSHLSMIPQVGV